jgi:hypothetical protein
VSVSPSSSVSGEDGVVVPGVVVPGVVVPGVVVPGVVVPGVVVPGVVVPGVVVPGVVVPGGLLITCRNLMMISFEPPPLPLLLLTTFLITVVV